MKDRLPVVYRFRFVYRQDPAVAGAGGDVTHRVRV